MLKDEPKFLQIVDKRYATIAPVLPKYKALCVFDKETAEYMLRSLPGLDFVFAMNEGTGTFARCTNMTEVEDFYTKQQ